MRMTVRAGTHTGHVVYALMNEVPAAANASMFGVLTTACPLQPMIFGLCSSDMMTIRLVGCMRALMV